MENSKITLQTVKGSEMSTIKIARPGHNHWHNQYIGIEFYGCVGETEDEFKLNVQGDKLWINKQFVDVRNSSTDWDWVPCSQLGKTKTVEDFDRPISPEEAAILRNPLLTNMAETFERCFFTVVAKNNDYGGSNNDPFANFRNSTIAGVSVEKGILVRLMDKMSRVSTLLDKEAMVKDEAITDTIEDAINYLAIMKAYINLKNK